MDGINVGSVVADVVPDARNFFRDLSAKLNPQADKLGEQLGKQFSDRIASGVRDGLSPSTAAKAQATRTGTEAGGSFADSFKKRMKAALADLPDIKIGADSSAADRALAGVRAELQSLHDAKLGVDISTTDALTKADVLRARLDALAASSADIRVKIDTGKASADLDKFLAEYRLKTAVAAEEAGDKDGSLLAQGMRNSFMRNSPLIAAAIGGALIAGAPAALAGAGVLFGGIAAVAVHANQQVDQAAHDAMNAWEDAARQTAAVTAPWFAGALGRIGAAADALRPQLSQAFSALEVPIDSLTSGFIALINNAMPGLVSALKAAGPVFQGLGDMLGRIGSGLGQFFGLIAQHGTAAGQVFSAIGQIVQELLPILGTLVGAGSELGAQILPALANVLGVVASALQGIAPILPGIVTGFLAFKAVSALSGPLGTLSAKLQTVAADGGKMTTALAGGGASAVSKLSGVLPALGIGLGLASAGFEAFTQQVDTWAQALNQGGAAAEQAGLQMSDSTIYADKYGGTLAQVMDALGMFAGVQSVANVASGEAKSKADELTKSMSPLQRAQQDVTKATNDYLLAREEYGANSGQAVGAAAALRDAQDKLKGTQDALNSVTGTSTSVTGELKGALQSTADAASAANTQIGLLKGSLDALTGKTISMGDAEVAVTNATIAATTAVQNKKGALVDATGALNLHTEAGAAAWQSLTALAGADNQLIGTMEQQGATSDQVRARDGQLRDSFIQTAEKMGFSAGQAQNLADQIYGIPSQRNVQINTNAADANAAIQSVQQQIDNLHGRNVTIAILAASSAGPAAYAVPGSGTGGLAKGGVIPGYAPGVDSVHAMLSPGEGVLVPEAVRGLGGAAGIRAINSAYSSRVPGFAAGGVVGPVPVNVYETAQPFNSALQVAANKLRDQMAVAFAPGAPPSVLGNAAIVQAAAAARGWTGAEWNALYALVMRESGFRNTAQNPTSTAYGMFQFLDSTWAGYGLGKTSDPRAQTRAGLDYIAGRYRDPLGAWGHETRYGWYDQGGLIPPGPSLVYNGTGQPELVAPAQTFKQVAEGMVGGGPASFTGNLYLDSGEFLGKVRGEAAAVVTEYADAAYHRSQYNPG